MVLIQKRNGSLVWNTDTHICRTILELETISSHATTILTISVSIDTNIAE